MNLNLENGWQILPIGGDTDTAYMGIKSDQKVFLKRNTSPFLAALSLEEIAPSMDEEDFNRWYFDCPRVVKW